MNNGEEAFAMLKDAFLQGKPNLTATTSRVQSLLNKLSESQEIPEMTPYAIHFLADCVSVVAQQHPDAVSHLVDAIARSTAITRFSLSSDRALGSSEYPTCCGELYVH